MNLAIKDIRHNLGRFALTTLGIGMLLMIVMGQGGIHRGIIEDATLLIETVGADLWVVQQGTRGPLAEVSRVPRSLVDRVAAVPGVASSREFVAHTIQRQRQGKVLRLGVVGVGWPNDRGEWLPLVEGRPLTAGHYEMLADRILGLGVGEQIKLSKETYTVVGLTSGMMTSAGDGMAFFSIADAQAIQFDLAGEAIRLERASRSARVQRNDLGQTTPQLREHALLESKAVAPLPSPAISAVLVRLKPDADPKTVAATIDAWGDVSVFSREEERQLMLSGSVEKVRRQIGLFRTLLTIISAIIMALILYTLTLDKLHAIALLKLIGTPNRKILGMILQQALILGGLGYLLGYLVGHKVFPYFPRRIILTGGDLLQLGLVVAGISVLSSTLAIWRALRVQPNEVLS